MTVELSKVDCWSWLSDTNHLKNGIKNTNFSIAYFGTIYKINLKLTKIGRILWCIDLMCTWKRYMTSRNSPRSCQSCSSSSTLCGRSDTRHRRNGSTRNGSQTRHNTGHWTSVLNGCSCWCYSGSCIQCRYCRLLFTISLYLTDTISNLTSYDFPVLFISKAWLYLNR